MDDVIFLLKDKRFIISNNLLDYYDDIQYLLIKTDKQLDTFILHKPCQYMLDMDEAIITYESVVTRKVVDYNYQIFHSPMDHVEKKVTNYIELFQYLNSLNKIRYFNFVSSSNESSDHEYIQFCYFKIEIYSKGRLLYKKKVVEKGKKYENKLNKNFFNPQYILEKILPIYDPFAYYEYYGVAPYLVLSPNRKTWDFKLLERTHIDDVCGILLSNAESYVFLNFDDLKLLDSRMNGVLTLTVLYEPTLETHEEIEEIMDSYDGADDPEYLSGPVRLIDYYAETVSDITEFFTYLPYIYLLLKTVAEINDKGKITDQYRIVSRVYFTTDNEYTQNRSLYCKDDNVISIMDIIQYLKEKR
jgi:hypothetical protein